MRHEYAWKDFIIIPAQDLKIHKIQNMKENMVVNTAATMAKTITMAKQVIYKLICLYDFHKGAVMIIFEQLNFKNLNYC